MQLVLFNLLIGPYQVLPFRARVEQWQWRGALHSPKFQYHLNLIIVLFTVISRTLIGRSYPAVEVQSMYSTAPADWATKIWWMKSSLNNRINNAEVKREFVRIFESSRKKKKWKEKNLTINASIIFQSVVLLRKSTHFKHHFLCQSRNSFQKKKKKKKRTLPERLWVFLCMYIFSSPVILIKTSIVVQATIYSPSLSPDESLLKPKRLNIDFTTIINLSHLGYFVFLFSSYCRIYFHDLPLYITVYLFLFLSPFML